MTRSVFDCNRPKEGKEVEQSLKVFHILLLSQRSEMRQMPYNKSGMKLHVYEKDNKKHTPNMNANSLRWITRLRFPDVDLASRKQDGDTQVPKRIGGQSKVPQ